jgi:hypothetical protein
MWFDSDTHHLPNGDEIDIPKGDLCMQCGTTAEIFPLMSQEEFISSIKAAICRGGISLIIPDPLPITSTRSWHFPNE